MFTVNNKNINYLLVWKLSLSFNILPYKSLFPFHHSYYLKNVKNTYEGYDN